MKEYCDFFYCTVPADGLVLLHDSASGATMVTMVKFYIDAELECH